MRPFLTCFLIDDDPDDHDIFKMALNGISDRLQCVTAADGADGIEKLERNEEFTPDYIFLDLNMPRVDGRACLKEIRKIERLTKVPVIIYSTSVAIKGYGRNKRTLCRRLYSKAAPTGAAQTKTNRNYLKPTATTNIFNSPASQGSNSRYGCKPFNVCPWVAHFFSAYPAMHHSFPVHFLRTHVSYAHSRNSPAACEP
jgi:CheY-like chemotaxis protein